MCNHVYIIAEAGVNHNGNVGLAKQLVDVAAKAGADAVKFQTFKAERLVSRTAVKADYQTRNTGSDESQFEMIKRLELDEAAHAELIDHCQSRGIQFLSTPFDLESVSLLAGRFDLPYLKMPSGDITNGPLLLEAARTRKPIILSTGMSTLGEVEDALGVLAYGYLDGDAQPSRDSFKEAYASEEGRRLLRNKVTLLHCTTEYPAPLNEVNLRAMDTLHRAFGLPVGYSDHTQGVAIPVAAVARGATMIEKHFTLDRSMPGPDHKASLEPDELAHMVKMIREVELSLGDGAKHATLSELKNLPVARKSLVVTRSVRSGESLTFENLGVKRPGNGISPLRYWEFLGRTLSQDLAADGLVVE